MIASAEGLGPIDARHAVLTVPPVRTVFFTRSSMISPAAIAFTSTSRQYTCEVEGVARDCSVPSVVTVPDALTARAIYSIPTIATSRSLEPAVLMLLEQRAAILVPTGMLTGITGDTGGTGI
jgi:hypothetical protein